MNIRAERERASGANESECAPLRRRALFACRKIDLQTHPYRRLADCRTQRTIRIGIPINDVRAGRKLFRRDRNGEM